MVIMKVLEESTIEEGRFQGKSQKEDDSRGA